MKPFIKYLEEAETLAEQRKIEDEGQFKSPDPKWFPTTQKQVKLPKPYQGSGAERSIANSGKSVDNPNGKIENMPHVKAIKK